MTSTRVWTREDASKNGIMPIMNPKPPVAQELLKTLCCKCMKGWSGNCSCSCIRCSVICSNCQGVNGSNFDRSVDMDEQIDIGMENFLSVEIDDKGHEDAADISQPTEIDSPTLKRKRLD